MSATEEKNDTKPFDSDYYKWSKQISESKKVPFLFLNNEKELERLGVDISPTRLEGASPVETAPSKGVSLSAWNKAGTWYELLDVLEE